jgi:hypothetical protein
MRQERTLFAMLWRLAQPGRNETLVLLGKNRLEFSEWGHPLCWIELDAAGLPSRLGYKLSDKEEESLYEFHDWNLEGPLPYPAHTRQVDRKTTVDLNYVEPNAKLDPSLWSRKPR